IDATIFGICFEVRNVKANRPVEYLVIVENARIVGDESVSDAECAVCRNMIRDQAVLDLGVLIGLIRDTLVELEQDSPSVSQLLLQFVNELRHFLHFVKWIVERSAFPSRSVQRDLRALWNAYPVFAKLLDDSSGAEAADELCIDSRVADFCDLPAENSVETVAVSEHFLCRKTVGVQDEVRCQDAFYDVVGIRYPFVNVVTHLLQLGAVQVVYIYLLGSLSEFLR